MDIWKYLTKFNMIGCLTFVIIFGEVMGGKNNWDIVGQIYCNLTHGQMHRWELTILRYRKIMVIYPYPFLVLIIQLFSYIIFINDCICI